MLEDKLALAQKDVSEKDFDLNKLKIEPTRLRLEATHKLTLEAAEAALLHKCKKPSIPTLERQSLEASASQKEQVKPGVSDSPLLCESVVGDENGIN